MTRKRKSKRNMGGYGRKGDATAARKKSEELTIKVLKGGHLFLL